MAKILKPFQLLEINIISAQDLEPVSKKMRTYATAWVHPNRKLSSRVDAKGHANPTWNDKFVFRVDEQFLREDTSAVMIEIHAVHWFRDTLVGTVRILVGNLIPPPARPHHHQHHIGMRFVALQVRRPSGRPQGILNIGVAVLDSSMRSMPLYTQPSTSAVGYRDFMDDPNLINQNNNDDNNTTNQPPALKPILRRTKSERSERLTFDKFTPGSSVVAAPTLKGAKDNGSSIILTHEAFKGKTKKGKASSVISGEELKEKPKIKSKKGKASSVVSDSIVSKPSYLFGTKKKKGQENDDSNKKANDAKPKGLKDDSPPKEKSLLDVKQVYKFNRFDNDAPKGNGKLLVGAISYKPGSVLSDLEVGPSASEVAAAMAEKRYPIDDNQSSVLDGWSLDESVEGLRSKLERWRTELPPLYDRGFSSSSVRSSTQHVRRHTDGGSGLFSCFGNICGYECQCVCGKPPAKKSGDKFQSPYY